jgi:hypothetical protein
MMEITRPTEEFYSYWKKIGSEARPLVIHIRRGDYEKESFGLLSKDYYQIQVSKALSDAKAKEIWIFTDDEVHSKHIISDISGLPKRVFRRQDFTAAETMQIMRFGHGYVIANSSFSYWAAMLRHNLDAKVFAPMPWFQKGVSPLNILPLNWISSMPIWESPDSVMD